MPTASRTCFAWLISSSASAMAPKSTAPDELTTVTLPEVVGAAAEARGERCERAPITPLLPPPEALRAGERAAADDVAAASAVCDATTDAASSRGDRETATGLGDSPPAAAADVALGETTSMCGMGAAVDGAAGPTGPAGAATACACGAWSVTTPAPYGAAGALSLTATAMQ